MRTQVITKTVYEFEELSDTAKQRAIESFRENNLDYDWWDFVYEDAARMAELLGIDLNQKRVKLMNGNTRLDPAIYFSGFCSQGDGARIEADYRYQKGAVKAITSEAPKDEELRRIAKGFQDVQQRNFYQIEAAVRLSGRYEHSGCTSIAVERRDGKEMSDNGIEAIKELLRGFMDWIYRQLERAYDWQQADEQIIENIKANKYEFDEEGRIA